jgi:preprotein translocase subunit SecF
MSIQEKVARFHDKHYKHLLIIPIAFLLLSVGYIWYFYSVNHDFIHKDISLTGGTTVTLYENLNPDALKNDLSDKLANLNVRTIYDLITQEQKAVVLETTTDIDTTKQILEDYLGYQLDDSNSSFEFTGSSLGQSFYIQLLIAILIAFIFMAIVVFILFRSFVPSAAVIISAFADITMTLFVVDVFGMTLSSAGIIAFLMLIGYSVDTDILLTTRLIKREEGSVNKRLFEAFKTGVTMTLTSIAAVGCALLIVQSFSSVLSQIFTILLIGLFFDIFNTWLTNASILKWYVNRKK